jgi:hypothetical protein
MTESTAFLSIGLLNLMMIVVLGIMPIDKFEMISMVASQTIL